MNIHVDLKVACYPCTTFCLDENPYSNKVKPCTKLDVAACQKNFG